MEPAEELLELLSLNCACHGNLLVGHSEVNIQHQRLLTRPGPKLDEELLFMLALYRDWSEYPLKRKYQLRRKKIGNFVNSFDWFKSETLGTALKTNIIFSA